MSPPPSGRRQTKREIRLSTWAEREGLSLRTAQRMFHRGTLPVPTKVTSTGRLMVLVDEPTRDELATEVARLRRQNARLECKLDRVLEALDSRG
jgi:predicted site-specific integrase-resolvase